MHSVEAGKVRELSRASRYAEDYGNLICLPDVGLITAMTILTEVSDIQRFYSQKKFMSHVGLIPVMKDSGDTIRVVCEDSQGKDLAVLSIPNGKRKRMVKDW